jgi:regulator of cell morphogenesis and NO signaling
MTPNPAQTVREIAIQNPATVSVFESLGIDYCCGGKRPLAEACQRANLSVDRVLALLSSATNSESEPADRSWTTAPLDELATYIVGTHHQYIRAEAPRLQDLARKVVPKHAAAHPELTSIEELFSAMADELFAHLMKEERILFPALRQLEAAASTGAPAPITCFDSVQAPIARMLADHDDAAELTSQIRKLAGSYQPPADACPSFRALYHGLEQFERDLHRHVHLENNILFPRAIELEASLRGTAHDRA